VLSNSTEEGAATAEAAKSGGGKSIVDNLKSMLNKPKAEAA